MDAPATGPDGAVRRSGSPVLARLRRAPEATLHLGLMLALTFATGINDAVGYLGLDRVFTGNMTGNVAILGMALLGADGLPVVGPLVALVGFLAGAAAGGRALKGTDGGWTRRVTVLFATTALIELVAGVGLLAGARADDRSVQLAVTAAVAAAMGLQAATARFLAVRDVTTVVVTSTLTGLASDSVLGSNAGGGGGRRLAAVALIIAGAAAGAALVTWEVGAGFVAAGVVTGIVTGAGALAARRASGYAAS
jgi:uncharacterized membrane protein YoaK (UPF0700 family)